MDPLSLDGMGGFMFPNMNPGMAALMPPPGSMPNMPGMPGMGFGTGFNTGSQW